MENRPGIQESIREAVQKHREEARVLSDDLGAHPELSDQEFESSKKIVELLRKSGFEVEYPFLGFPTAFRGVIYNGDGPRVALMVEYDALPEVGHGCGHNLHGSLVVLTALALKELTAQFKGNIHVIGTPGEEVAGAKIGLAEKGAFDGCAAALMMHSTSGGICQPNMDALSLRCYNMEFRGKSAHAVAGPWEGHSALAAARKFIDLVDARRECFTPDMHFNAIFLDGGKAPNVIPSFSALRVEFRTDSLVKLQALDEAIAKCARAAAMALDCEASWTRHYEDFADVVRVKPLEDEIERILLNLGQKVEAVSPPIGSTDVGNVSYRCPSLQPLIAITREAYALHTLEFAAATMRREAHEVMAIGARALTELVLKLLGDEVFRRAVKEDFIRRRDAKLGNSAPYDNRPNGRYY
jgi:amidohydrolase